MNVLEADSKILYKQAEAAELLGISRATLWRLVASGQILPVRLGALVRFRRSELERFAAAAEAVPE